MKAIIKRSLLILMLLINSASLFSMQRCPSLVHLAMGQVIKNIIQEKSSKEEVINVMPYNLRQIFLELLATAQKKYEPQAVENDLERIFTRMDAHTKSLISWLTCKFIATPAVSGIDLLIRAAYDGNLDIVEYLVEKAGINVNNFGKLSTKLPLVKIEDVTPLMAAAYGKSFMVINYLLRHGAYIHQRNDKQDTALSIAVGTALRTDQSSITLLSLEKELAYMLENKNVHISRRMVEPLLQQGSARFRSIIKTIFAQEQHVDPAIIVIALLLEHKAFPNIRNMYGNTPLIIAIENTNPIAVELLLRYQANPNLRSGENKDPDLEEYNIATPRFTPLELVQGLMNDDLNQSDPETMAALNRIKDLLDNAIATKASGRAGRIRN